MSNDLDRAFSALAHDADRARLATGRDVRRRGDRRTVVQAVAGVAAIAVVVTGVTIGTRVLLAGPDPHRPAPLPAGSTTPTPIPSAPPKSATSPPPSSAPSDPPNNPTIPSAIPAKAFLAADDVPGTTVDGPKRLSGETLPRFCAKDYDQAGRIGVRATQGLAFTGTGAPPGSTPKAAIDEFITVYQGSAAQAFMSDLRAAVRSCPAPTSSGVTLRNYLRGSLNVGDDSLLIEQTRPATGDAGEPVGNGTLHHTYWAAIRVGDSIAFVSNGGWESVTADRSDTVHLGQRASARLTAWRG
jgi:hypothetical protein